MRGTRRAFAASVAQSLFPTALAVLVLVGNSATAGAAEPAAHSVAARRMERIEARGGHFVDGSGEPVRFWGLNLVSAFPPVEQADAFAARIAALGVNLVRPHHLMRPSRDWIVKAPVKALALFEENSRDLDEEAWRRFDALNAALRRRGIRLALSLHFSRRFLPGDAAILEAGTDDAREWADAVAELNSWPWQKAIDPVKMLPAIDRRALALQREFAERLLTHKNPFTGLTYAEDPQVLTIEVVNECSCEYTLVCGNRFPDYFERALQALWEKYAAANGEPSPGLHRDAATLERKQLRARFYRSLDEDYFTAMLDLVRRTGSKAAVTYSNLWRGDDQLAMTAARGDYIEDHAYVDPRVANGTRDWTERTLTQTRLAGKPFILGEFGEAEGASNIREQGYARTQLMLSGAAVGAYHDLDGIVWFAYNHGDRAMGPDGTPNAEGRLPAPGDMVADGMMLDHMLPCAVIFRRGLVSRAGICAEIEAPVPVDATSYSELMRSWRYPVPEGVMSRQTARKVLVPPDSEGVAVAAKRPVWEATGFAQDGRFVSDTGEIVRDVAARRLLVATPQAEAFSGECAGATPSEFTHLDAGRFIGEAAEGQGLSFATVIVAALDGLPLAQSRRIVVSRTGLDAEHAESCGLPHIALNGLAGGKWKLYVTRPGSAAAVLRDLAGISALDVRRTQDGAIELPPAIWTQAILERR